MVKPAEKIIYIQDHEGERVRFDPVELQTRLINCFLTAGLRESCHNSCISYSLTSSCFS